MNSIIFDVDDTMYDQALSFHHTFRQLVEDSYTYEEIDQIYRTSRKYSEILFDQSERGEISVKEWLTGRIMKACEDFGIPMDVVKAEKFDQVYKQEQNKIELFPEIEELFTRLKKQDKQLAILTNGEEKHQSMKIKQLQLEKWIPKENIFISGTYSVAKPKKEIFDIVASKLGCQPDQTVYIGDSYEKDIVGAKQAGWQAIWMNHRNRTIPLNSPYQPDIEVHNAEELLHYFSE
ncbi:putative hydrolase of the HAD superfamily [Gracilibacillus ureilyticus]|uniref:Putative hydrolase of the HAD superfamily n=1 Tax=Gracilibacillus ureilyticus TaxID=531814 RepID=A0A1H9M711_9BACI|nr:HAD family hydrolase [Gracilibacillus ureilyticus]SER19275.1 putative hydrolase of the HAD superfamily [Gracilibacillus ureilyticus]